MSMLVGRSLGVLLFGAFATSACTGDYECTMELAVYLSPRDTTIAVADTFTPAIGLSGCGGREQLSDRFSWHSEDTTLASVDSVTGTVTGRWPGETFVQVAGEHYGALGAVHVAVINPYALDSCEVSVRDETPPIQTDTLCYALRDTGVGYLTWILFTATNPSSDTTYYMRYCGSGTIALILQKLIDTEWVDAWVPVVPRCGWLAPFPPQSQYRSAVVVFGGYPSNNYNPKFMVDSLPGIYRLHWSSLYADSIWGEQVPLVQRTSNPFHLAVSR